MAKPAERIISQLIMLAGEERKLLLRGRLEDLARLEPVKSTLLDRLERASGPTDPKSLARLRKLADENQRLYESALLGVRRVRDQVASLVNGNRPELKTYTPEGNHSSRDRRPSTIVRKA